MTRTISMNSLAPGEKGTVLSILSQGPMRRRLQELGLTAGSPVECVGRSPGGDPSAFLIAEAVIAIRSDDCRDVILLHGI